MNLQVPLENQLLPPQYTNHANPDQKIANIPVVSFPITIADVPEDTKSLALTFTDDDAIPVCGFSFIHWVAANISPNVNYIPVNASQEHTIELTRGNNSNAGKLINNPNPQITQYYAGPTPPNGVHNYTLTIYALDKMLPLKNGFWLNEMQQQMQQHIITRAKLIVPAD